MNMIGKYFDNLNVAKKLTVIIATAALATGVFSGIITSFIARNQVAAGIEEDIEHQGVNIAEKIELYLKNVKDDVKQLAQSPTTAEAMNKFNGAWKKLDTPQTTLQNAYIINNPYEVGQKHKLQSASDNSKYSQIHKKYHDVFQAIRNNQDYYDIFLINPNGDIVYTVFKEDDYATNLVNGHYQSTELARLFREINKNPKENKIVFKSLKQYSPSFGAPASFMGIPIFDNDKYIGVAAVQFRADKLSNLLTILDEHIATYVVGSNGYLWNDIPHTQKNDILKQKVKINNIEKQVDKFLSGQKGIAFNSVLYHVNKIDFFGNDAYFVIEHNDEVLVADANRVTYFAVGIAVFIGVLSAFCGFLYTRRFARPIAELANTVDKIAQGYNVDIPCKDNKDELGTLARSLTVINDLAISSSRVKTAVDIASAQFMIADDNLNIVYANPSVANTLLESQDYFRHYMPGINLNKIIGTNLMDFHGKKNDHVRNMLKELNNPYETRIQFDDRTFRLVVTPVYDGEGHRIGFVTEWLEKTEEVKALKEAELRKVQEQQIEAQVAEVIQAAANGNFKQRLNVQDDRQSIISISNGINQICQTVDTFFDDLNTTVTAFSNGDLTKTISGNYAGQFCEVQENLNQSFFALSNTISEISSVGQSIKAASAEITKGADNLSSRTESQAASLEETGATMEEISTSVRSNANSAIQANGLAQKTLEQAENSRGVVSQAIQAMHQIETSAQRISEIVSVIDSIASQTNLLALNAAVEAARAGEAGKGFAVVASEVRTLASRCSDAAHDIRGLISGSNAQVIDGVKLVNATGNALSQIVESVTNVTSTVGLISQASREQATGIEEISGAISQMDEMTQQNAGLADSSAVNARKLAEQAKTLSELVSAFKTDSSGKMLNKVSKKMLTERNHNSSTIEDPYELPEEKFSEFGKAYGDDWSNF